MIVVAVVIGFSVAICVAGWVPVVRDALQVDHVLPGPPSREAAGIVDVAVPDTGSATPPGAVTA